VRETVLVAVVGEVVGVVMLRVVELMLLTELEVTETTVVSVETVEGMVSVTSVVVLPVVVAPLMVVGLPSESVVTTTGTLLLSVTLSVAVAVSVSVVEGTSRVSEVVLSCATTARVKANKAKRVAAKRIVSFW